MLDEIFNAFTGDDAPADDPSLMDWSEPVLDAAADARGGRTRPAGRPSRAPIVVVVLAVLVGLGVLAINALGSNAAAKFDKVGTELDSPYRGPSYRDPSDW